MLIQKIFDYFMARRKMKALFRVGNERLNLEMMYQQKGMLSVPAWLERCVWTAVRPDSTNEETVKIYSILTGIPVDRMREKMKEDCF